MKYNTLLLSLLAATAFTVGCEKTDSTAKQLDKVEEKTAVATQDMKDYTFAQKNEFVAKMQAQLADLNKELDTLAAKVDKSSDTIKAGAQPRLQALREQTAGLNKQLDEARNATDSTWDNVKSGFQKAYDSSKAGFDEARQWVSDKIAP